MDIASTKIVERIARVLAGEELSINAEGSSSSAAAQVDEHWHEHREAALAVLRTMRAPDPVMAQAGDPAVWEAMILAAIRDGTY